MSTEVTEGHGIFPCLSVILVVVRTLVDAGVFWATFYHLAPI
jgi:hypothetical protein